MSFFQVPDDSADGFHNASHRKPAPFATDYGVALAAGLITNRSVKNISGRNGNIGATFEILSEGGIYRTPQAGSATALRIKAGGNANDTAAGSGAREVTLVGLDQTGALKTETLATAGASASAATTTTFMRLLEAYVSASGSYATMESGSHDGDIVIEKAAGSEDWATISVGSGLAQGETEIAAYTIPLGYTGYLTQLAVSSDATKSTDFLMVRRQNILETAAPYSALREIERFDASAGSKTHDFQVPRKLPALTDIGMLAEIPAGAGSASASMSILLVKS